MEIILIILTGTLMGALNFGFFCLGYYIRGNRQDEGVKLTKDNADFVKEMMEWRMYGGE